MNIALWLLGLLLQIMQIFVAVAVTFLPVLVAIALTKGIRRFIRQRRSQSV